MPARPDGTRFRPSNSDEGLGFEMQWCDRCERDREWREAEVNPCQIHNDALCDEADEWQYRDGHAVCTAFVSEGEPLPVEVHPNQLTIGETTDE